MDASNGRRSAESIQGLADQPFLRTRTNGAAAAAVGPARSAMFTCAPKTLLPSCAQTGFALAPPP
jgi:hypothetical protein